MIVEENICIADDGKVRITDVGVDALVHRTGNRSSNSVPKNWMYKAREELELGARTMQTDTYSFATTVYCVWSCPFICGHPLTHTIRYTC